MEHIVQISINVDDNRIKEICEQTAAKQIVDDVKLAAYGKNRWRNEFNEEPENLKPLFAEEVHKVVDENKDKIIELAIKEVTKSIMKTKAVKEAVGDMLNEVVDNE